MRKGTALKFMRYNIHFVCTSHIGNVRAVNQDNYICAGRYIDLNATKKEAPLLGAISSENSSLFGVFDGMGGEECGEIASYIAAKNAAALKIGPDVISDLSRFCYETNDELCDYVNKNNITSMGTTAAMLAFTREGIALCNIGDTKIFRISDGIIEKISKDHLAVAAFGVKPPLSQNLGIPSNELLIEPYLAQGKYEDGDIFLICSDGLTDMLTVDEILEIIQSNALPKAGELLVEKALEKGGKDNITIILLNIKKEKTKLFSFWKNGGKK